MHQVVDDTGLKVFDDAEWKAHQYGTSKHRNWRKVYLAVDEKAGLVKAATTNSMSDGQTLPELLEQVTQPIVTGVCRWRLCPSLLL